MPSEAFPELMRRVRAGDEAAAAQLVRTYSPEIHRFLRVQMAGMLGPVDDSSDICQEVLGSFFVRTALGQFVVDSPKHLINLLLTMARNKAAMKARRPRPRAAPACVIEEMIPGADPSPSKQVALNDLVQKVRAELTEDERRLADLRAQGMEWPEIAVVVGEQPDALRMRLHRGAERVARHLGLEEFLRD